MKIKVVKTNYGFNWYNVLLNTLPLNNGSVASAFGDNNYYLPSAFKIKLNEMTITYPHTIENCVGEKLIFKEIQKEPGGDKVLVENYVTPGHGPLMHTHWLQDEALTVIKGQLGYQIMGEAKKYAGEGETILFTRGTPHRFWNAGLEVLHCKGWLKPANTIVFFLSSIYAAQNKSGKAQPEQFDAAYLIKRYSAEYDLPEIPKFVKKVIIPITYAIGKLLGKYKHFKNAPDPVRETRRK